MNRTGFFTRGQRVEVDDDGVWRPGEARMLDDITVRNTRTGRNENVQSTEVMSETPLVGNRPFMPGDNVLIQHGRRLVPGTFVSRNYFVAIDNGMIESIPHTRIRLAEQPRAAAPAEQPRAAAPAAQTFIFGNGQQVEMEANGEWLPAQVVNFQDYTVSDEAGTTHNTARVRPEGSNLIANIFRLNRNMPPGSRIDFALTNRFWDYLPGTMVSYNYQVSPIGEGPTQRVPHTRIRLQQAAAVAQPRVAAQPAAQPRPVEDAFEIHKAFAELNFNKFMTIIRRETNGASNFKNRENVLEPLLSYINSSDTTLTSEQKTRYTENFRRPTRGIIDRVNDFIRDHPNVKNDTLEVIQFVLSQDRIYKDLFIETFENECIGAYSSGSKESCTKGMWERIFLSNKGTIGGLCSDEITGNASSSATAAASSCKPMYLELYDTFVPDIDLERIFMNWYNEFSYDAIPEEEDNPLKNLSADERKQHYRDFVKKEVTQRIWNNEDFQNKLEKSIKKNRRIIETLDAGVTGEGVKRRKSKKTKNKRSRSKNQRNSKKRKRLKIKK